MRLSLYLDSLRGNVCAFPFISPKYVQKAKLTCHGITIVKSSPAMGKSKQKMPIIKKLEPHVFLAARLGGMGVALSASVAEDILEMIV